MPEQTLADNLQRLTDTVPAIGNAIIAKGGTVGANDGLEEFATDIMSIKNDLTSIDITENGTYYSGDETVVTSSAFPIVINDSNGTPVRHVDINGNAVQSGTPTPSNPVEVNGVGERTENLYDKSAKNTNNGYISDGFLYSDGSKGVNGAYHVSEYITVTPNQAYTLQYASSLIAPSVCFYDSSKNFISGIAYNGKMVVPFTTPQNATYLRFSFMGRNEDEPMLNIGSTALPYEPYGYKIPISSANTTTPVYLGEVETTRRIKKLVLTGEENFILKDRPDTANYLYVLRLYHKNTIGVCSHLPYADSYPRTFPGFRTDASMQLMYMCIGPELQEAQPGGNTVEGFRYYLAAQYAAGTPVTIWYVLETEETGIVNEPLMKIGDYADSLSVDVELPLLQNTKNNIDVNTTLKPSSASFTYNKLSEYIGYNEINVDVSNTYTQADEGKVVNNATLVPQTAMSAEITANDTYDTTLYNSIVVNVPSTPSPTPSVESNDVNFYDYDGTIVHSYSASEFANLSAMPANPSHDGLTAQGWNWSLADAKTYVAKYCKLNIGQMYITYDGKTRLYISLPEGRTSPVLQLYLNANSELDIDWGDGSTHSTFTSTSASYKSERHEYSASGDYVISITVVSGGFVLQSSSTDVSSILWNGNDSQNSPDRSYNNAIKKVEMGNNVISVCDYAFYYCYSLSSITIPSSVTSIEDAFCGCYSLSSITIPYSVTYIDSGTFRECYSLSSVAIPDSVTHIGEYAFSDCYSLSSITIPDNGTSIGDNAFSSCYSLSSVAIPDSVTDIGNSAFYDCYSLSSITIPDSITYISGYAFCECHSLSSITIPNSVTSIGDSAFYYCYALSSITIPSSVESIGDSAFCECSYMSYIKFESTTPPTVEGSSTWDNVSTSTKILVPAGTLEIYKSASNYPDPNSYAYEEY